MTGDRASLSALSMLDFPDRSKPDPLSSSQPGSNSRSRSMFPIFHGRARLQQPSTAVMPSAPDIPERWPAGISARSIDTDALWPEIHTRNHTLPVKPDGVR